MLATTDTLRIQIGDDCRAYEQAYRTLCRMENQRHHFLTRYYDELGLALPRDLQQAPKRAQQTPELKRLYRQMMKTLHPDSHNHDETNTSSHRLLGEIHNAYRSRSLFRLQQLYCHMLTDEVLSGGSPDVPALHAYATHIRARLDETQAAIARLEQSDSYQLMLKIIRARIRGVDLVPEIKAALAGAD